MNRIIYLFIFLFILCHPSLGAENDEQLFIKTLERLKNSFTEKYYDHYKKSAFSIDPFVRGYGHGGFGDPEETINARGNIRILMSLLENEEFVNSKFFKGSIPGIISSVDNYPFLSGFLVYLFSCHPKNQVLAKISIKALVAETKKVQNENKWNLLFIIDRIISNISYSKELEVFLSVQLNSICFKEQDEVTIDFEKKIRDEYKSRPKEFEKLSWFTRNLRFGSLILIG